MMNFLFLRRFGCIAVASISVVAGCTQTLDTALRDGSGESSTDGMLVGDGLVDSVDVPSIDSAPDATVDDTSDVPQDTPADATSDASDADAPGDTNLRDIADAGDSDARVCVSAEICNGVDDTCDDVIDENIPVRSCGVGACRRTVPGCAAGMVPACTPGSPTTEVCNGLDDDCDGMVDDAIPDLACGLGACRRTVPACARGVSAICMPGAPAAAETCGDAVDNDCDGAVDDGCFCDRYVLLGGTGTGVTMADPMGSVQAAIASLATAGGARRVCVGAPQNGLGAGCLRTVYQERIQMAEGVSVFGSFSVNARVFTRDPACLAGTVLQSPDGVGVFFGHGISNATQLDGFTILGPPASSSTTAAVTMQAAGTLSNNTITAGSAATSICVDVNGSPPAAVGPTITRNTIGGPSGSGGTSSVDSIGVRVRNPATTIQSNLSVASGFGAAGTSTAIRIEGARNTIVADNSSILSGTSTGISSGIWISGDATGVQVVRNAAIHGGGPSGEARGIRLETCTGRPFIANNALIQGGTASTTLGINVSACNPQIAFNDVIVGRAGSGGSTTRGVYCTGSGADCDVRSNRRIAGSDMGTVGGDSVGVFFATGATGQVVRNRSIAGCGVAGNTCTGVFMMDTTGAPLVSENVLEVNRSALWGNGIRVARSNAVVANNLVLLDRHLGISLGLARGSVPTEATVVSNTVIAVALPGGTPPQASLLDIDFEGTSIQPPNGVVRNNVLACVGTGVNRTAAHESGNSGDPRIFENNDMWNCSVLYFDADGARSLTTLAAINGLSDITSRNNLGVDPSFVNPGVDMHLLATSMLIDRGAAVGAPVFTDFDGDPRALRLGPDIGFDEVP